MYHYVRDLKHSRYPEINGLDVELFKQQIQYIIKHYKVIRMEELIESVLKKSIKLPNNSLLLTFDDAYKDHFEFVFPILDELNIQGSFFPPAKAIQEHKVLDVNKIHFILASVKDKKQIVSDIFSMLDKFQVEHSLENNEYYYKKLAIENRFDTAEVIFIKRILQKELPENLRNIIVNSLFNKYVSVDETSFSRELYMNIDQLKCMRRKGMYIGSHGYNHNWLNTLSKEKQKKEIELSIEFLEKIGCNTENFAFCYPYGAYNESLLSVLKENRCSLALTTQVGIANMDKPLILPRLDTNDLPKDKLANINEWTLKSIND